MATPGSTDRGGARKSAALKSGAAAKAGGGANGKPTAKRTSKKVGKKAGARKAAEPFVGVMTARAARAWLDGRVNVERMRPGRVPSETFKLDRMHGLMAELGDPHRTMRVLHVAGSKGKGSVVEMLSAALGGCGYAVGTLTSPHLVDARERIRIGGDEIEEGELTRVLSSCRVAAEAIAGEHGEATYFELMTAAGLLYLAQKAVDFAVVEVGLGGRLDATNVVEPDVAIVTEIQLEHTEILGDTVEAIAGEKAGIFKPGCVALTGPQDEGVLGVLRERAVSVGCELLVLGEEIDFTWRFEAAHKMEPHARVSVTSERSAFEHLPSPLFGEHQAVNCGLALAAIDQLKARGFDAHERDVAMGLSRTRKGGRCEMVLEQPRILVDGAHTPESLAALIKSLGSTLSYDSLVVIFGCAADKPAREMLAEIEKGADKIIVTKSSSNPRAADPGELHGIAQELSERMVQQDATLKDAINTAARAISGDDLICVTGSFYLAGEAKRLIEEMKAARGLS